MLLVILKYALKNTARGIMRTLLRSFSPILNLLFHITLLVISLTWPAIQYPIKVAYILGIFTINCLASPMDTERIGIHGLTVEVCDSIFIRAFHKENIILVQYIISAWWFHFLDRLVHYNIRPGSIA